MIFFLIDILKTVRIKFTDESDMIWTSYETAEEVRNEIDGYIAQLENGDISCIEDINFHFLATSIFQEHSMQNGWTEEYHVIAKRFDANYERLKAGK